MAGLVFRFVGPFVFNSGWSLEPSTGPSFLLHPLSTVLLLSLSTSELVEVAVWTGRCREGKKVNPNRSVGFSTRSSHCEAFHQFSVSACPLFSFRFYPPPRSGSPFFVCARAVRSYCGGPFLVLVFLSLSMYYFPLLFYPYYLCWVLMELLFVCSMYVLDERNPKTSPLNFSLSLNGINFSLSLNADTRLFFLVIMVCMNS